MEDVIDDLMSNVPKRISRYWKSSLTIPMCQVDYIYMGTHLEGYTFSDRGKARKEKDKKGIFLNTQYNNIKSLFISFSFLYQVSDKNLAYELHFVSNDIDANPIGYTVTLSGHLSFDMPGNRDISLWSMLRLCQSQVEENRDSLCLALSGD